MADISKHPFDTQATQAEIDEFMKTTAVPGASAEYLHDWELAHGYRVRDDMNPSVLHEVQKVAEAAPSQVSAKLPDGTIFTGTAEEVSAKVTEHLVRQAEAARQQQDDSPTRDTNGRFVKQPGHLDGADRVANEVVDKGVESWLARQGIDPDALRDATALKSYEKSWAYATQEFLKSTADYPGGESVQQAMGEKIIELGFDNYPTAANLKKAWEAVQADADRYVALRDAKTPEEIEAILGKTERESQRRVVRGNV